jgi:hypothetical protein
MQYIAAELTNYMGSKSLVSMLFMINLVWSSVKRRSRLYKAEFMAVLCQEPARRPSARELLGHDFICDASLPERLKARVADHVAQQRTVRRL